MSIPYMNLFCKRSEIHRLSAELSKVDMPYLGEGKRALESHDKFLSPSKVL